MNAPAFIKIGALTHRYVDDGPREAETLVFIHGIGCDLDCWAEVAAICNPTYRCIRYDLCGHGLTDTADSVVSLSDYCKNLTDLLERLGVTSATFIGVSLGGLIAQFIGAQAPASLIRRIVLCATLPRIGTAEFWSNRIKLLRASGLEAAADDLVNRWFTPAMATRSPALHRGWRNRLARSPLDGYLAACAALRDGDFRPHINALQMPTLVIAGEHDSATPADDLQAFAATLPNARFVVIADCAHLPPIEQPAATAAELLRFLREAK